MSFCVLHIDIIIGIINKLNIRSLLRLSAICPYMLRIVRSLNTYTELIESRDACKNKSLYIIYLKACELGKTDLVEFMINYDVRNYCDLSTGLIIAAKYNQHQTMKYLVSKLYDDSNPITACINSTNSTGRIDLELLKFLIDENSYTKISGTSVITHAFESYQSNFVELYYDAHPAFDRRASCRIRRYGTIIEELYVKIVLPGVINFSNVSVYSVIKSIDIIIGGSTIVAYDGDQLKRLDEILDREEIILTLAKIHSPNTIYYPINIQLMFGKKQCHCANDPMHTKCVCRQCDTSNNIKGIDLLHCTYHEIIVGVTLYSLEHIVESFPIVSKSDKREAQLVANTNLSSSLESSVLARFVTLCCDDLTKYSCARAICCLKQHITTWHRETYVLRNTNPTINEYRIDNLVFYRRYCIKNVVVVTNTSDNNLIDYCYFKLRDDETEIKLINTYRKKIVGTQCLNYLDVSFIGDKHASLIGFVTNNSINSDINVECYFKIKAQAMYISGMFGRM